MDDRPSALCAARQGTGAGSGYALAPARAGVAGSVMHSLYWRIFLAGLF
jgi:hypothetical protein